jgi:4-azaleucine resistance transporter AzlC
MAGGTGRPFGSGLRASVPVVLGYLPAAFAFGIAAGGAGLGTVETVLMSMIVYSGASQFALVGLFSTGASLAVAAGTALVLGTRHLLYGPAVARRLRPLGVRRASLAAFGLTDEVFAVASARLPAGVSGYGWLLGLELGAYASWAGGSWVGAVAGEAVAGALPSLSAALAFALPALFVALLVPLLAPSGDGGRLPVVLAVFVAVVVAAALHLSGLGSWSVPAAGVAGPVAGLLLGRRA